MRPSKPSLCDLCEYFVPGLDPANDRGKPVCRAFPEGIPDEILNGGFDHRQQFDSETITFKRAEGVTEEDVEEWEQTVLEIDKQDLLGMMDSFGGLEPPE